MNDEPKKITRIDLHQSAHGVLVEKYAKGWTASTRGWVKVNTEMSMDDMVAYLKDHGWIVYEWPGVPELSIDRGARAFLGKPMPVRSKAELIRRRSELQERLEQVLSRQRRTDAYTDQPIPLPINLSTIDLALCL
jgi:hypothetical protein